MQIENGLDSVLFYEYYLRDKTEEEMQKICHYLEKKIKSLAREAKLKWKYNSKERAKKISTLGGYRYYLSCTELAIEEANKKGR